MESYHTTGGQQKEGREQKTENQNKIRKTHHKTLRKKIYLPTRCGHDVEGHHVTSTKEKQKEGREHQNRSKHIQKHPKAAPVPGHHVEGHHVLQSGPDAGHPLAIGLVLQTVCACVCG